MLEMVYNLISTIYIVNRKEAICEQGDIVRHFLSLITIVSITFLQYCHSKYITYESTSDTIIINKHLNKIEWGKTHRKRDDKVVSTLCYIHTHVRALLW